MLITDTALFSEARHLQAELNFVAREKVIGNMVEQ